MTVRIVRLGTPRIPDEGLRLGTVRRPPRGVPKAEFARRDFYDVWLPTLAPSEPLVKEAMATHDAHAAHPERAWKSFERKFRAEMKRGDAAHLLDTLAALSHQTNFSLGCYCEDENLCHRSILRKLLAERGAKIS
ncbi:MAG: DUF488 domain-containing protein [Acidobacteriota bacterium]